jgi:L-cysteine:1D-myo-inositol 2-amino-2-deoxy-alpha-D-glucopyranoside ligase
MRLYNTQSGAIEPVLVNSDSLRLYVCGITPYDTTHVGHAFTFLTFDILIRLLRHVGQRVSYVQNVTDIDDDILRKAGEIGLQWNELGERETQKYLRDMRELNWVEPDYYVRATDHVPAMVDLIEKLVAKGLAYESNGSIYFEVARDPEFGKLSHLAADEMLPIANERGNDPDDPNKRDPLDFILWQAAKPGEPTWESPWSRGRPGWHIECSAMATRYLGPSIDIHGGGADLIFPHHECELAQSENATGIEPFSRHWVHVGMVEYQDEKMSKSLGNLVLVSDILKEFSADVLRLYAFSHHYRLAWEYQDDVIGKWIQTVRNLQEALEKVSPPGGPSFDAEPFRTRFINAMTEDLDTPAAIVSVVDLSRSILHSTSSDLREAQRTLREMTGVLGLVLN